MTRILSGRTSYVRFAPERGHAACFASHSHRFFALVTLAPIGRPCHSHGHAASCLGGLPVRCAGSFAGIFRPTRVCRFVCPLVGSAFRYPIPFRNPRRLVKRFVLAPFLFAGRYRLSLSDRRRRKCKSHVNSRTHNQHRSFSGVIRKESVRNSSWRQKPHNE